MPVIDGSRSHDRLEPTVEPSTLPVFKVRDVRAKLEPQPKPEPLPPKNPDVPSLLIQKRK
jgi:hypothetical protein